VAGVALLPATAVDSTGGVLLVGAEDRLESQMVPVLRRQGDDVIVDVRGIAGREVVVERSPLLGAGIRINPIRPATSASAVPPEMPTQPETIVLTPERRAGLIAFVEANNRMPDEAKARMLEQLAQDQVPAQVVARLEDRMGG